MAYINSIAYYLPENKLTNNTINESFPEWGIEKISSKTGIRNRHISKNNEFSSDMAVKAAENLFKEQNIDRSKIDFLIFCTQTPDYILPTTACILQNRLGLSRGIGAIDYNLGCSGFVYGLAIAKGLIKGNIASNVLLLTSESYSKLIHPEDKRNLTIFGDGASATLITEEKGKLEIGDFELGTDGSGYSNLIVKNGGSRFSKNSKDVVKDEYGNIISSNHLYMNGPEIFNFTSQAIPALTHSILKKISLQKENIDLFIFHQANKFMLDFLRKKINITEEQFFIFLENCGNTVSSTIPIALYEAINIGKIKNAKNIILEGFGVGYSWGACHLKVIQ